MFEDLLEEYRKTLKTVVEAHKDANEYDRPLLGSAIVNLRYVIFWLETGFEPPASQNINRLSYEQREKLVDPQYMARYYAAQARAYKADEALSEFLDDVLAAAGVTEREKEALLKVRGLGWSFQETAEWMKVSKGSVQTWVERAEEKIRFVVKRKNGSKNPQAELQKSVQRVMFV